MATVVATTPRRVPSLTDAPRGRFKGGVSLLAGVAAVLVVGLTVAIVPSPAWFRRSEPVTRPLGW